MIERDPRGAKNAIGMICHKESECLTFWLNCLKNLRPGDCA